MDQTILTTMILTAVVVAAVTYELTKRSCRKTIGVELERDFEAKRNSLVGEAKVQLRNDEGHIALLHNEYLRGKTDGANEEIAKFSVTFQPYSIVKEEYMGIKKRAELGYEMQIFYGQFPIGDPTKRITNEDVKFDQGVIDKLMNSEVMGFLNSVSQLMLTKGMNTKVLPKKSTQG